MKFISSVEELNERGKWTRLAFERSIRIYYVGNMESGHKYQVFCPDAEFQFERTTEPNHVMLKRMSFVFDEVVLSTDEAGTITALHNFPFLQYRWAQIRERLSNDYDCDEFTEQATRMDALLGSQESVIGYLQLPSMLGLYFNGYLGEHLSHIPQLHQTTFGRVAGNITIEETIHHEIKENSSQRQERLEISGHPIEEVPGWKGYSGNFSYLDGVLEHGHKRLDWGTRRLNYSAKWHGLKKYFQ
jgi:hypothetical protein